MTIIAAQIEEVSASILACQRRAPILIAKMALRIFRQRAHIGRQGVEIGAESCLGITQRRAARAGKVICVAHKSAAAKRISNVAFEILNLIEVCRPMDPPMTHTSTTL